MSAFPVQTHSRLSTHMQSYHRSWLSYPHQRIYLMQTLATSVRKSCTAFKMLPLKNSLLIKTFFNWFRRIFIQSVTAGHNYKNRKANLGWANFHKLTMLFFFVCCWFSGCNRIVNFVSCCCCGHMRIWSDQTYRQKVSFFREKKSSKHPGISKDCGEKKIQGTILGKS